jgi:hypothetical protein
MAQPFRVKVKDRKEFELAVYGADSFIEHWPEILNEGAEVIKSGSMFYLCNTRKGIVSDSAFFSPGEMKYLEKI